MTEAIEYEKRIADMMLSKGLKLMVAESCTGGLIGHLLTNVPGSSGYYLGSVTAYAYEVKERLLGVKHTTLEKYGAVSRETAQEMAEGIKTVLAGDFPIENTIGLSVTGIAGPGGATPTKPVGLVFIGLSTQHGSWTWQFEFQGTRLENKNSTAQAALRILVENLEAYDPGF